MPDLEVQTLRLARVHLPDFHPLAPGTDDVFAFLVRDGHECVLVDTGVGSDNDLIDQLYQPERVALERALEEAGAGIDEVTAVINSHLHFDHCGNNRLFPGVPIYAQEAELDASTQRGYTIPEWVDFEGALYVPVSGPHAISEHLELLPTPGHTPGHQSLRVHAPEGAELVVAQAAHTAAEFESFVSGDFEPPEGHWSPEAYVSSLEALAACNPVRAYFSHDAQAWTRAWDAETAS
ncbi:MAG: N-acyl homoserine lactonase family protein [Myxococcota bacterium]|nr:N-acyl homoserine lactonase family protein [Myxococcota bacterium]